MHVNQIRSNEARVQPFDFRQLVQKNKFKCPQCTSIIYSRKSRFCGVCGTTLPESFLFNAAERELLTRTMSRERTLHREWISKREEPGWDLVPLQ